MKLRRAPGVTPGALLVGLMLVELWATDGAVQKAASDMSKRSDHLRHGQKRQVLEVHERSCARLAL